MDEKKNELESESGWGYSLDGEYYEIVSSRQEAVEMAMAEAKEFGSSEIYVAPAYPLGLRWDVEDLIEDLQENLCDDAGEYGENFELTADDAESLKTVVDQAINGWIVDNNISTNCYHVGAVEKINLRDRTMRTNLFKAKTTAKDIEHHAFDNIWVYGDLIHSGDKLYIHPVGNLVSVQGELGNKIILHEVRPETVCRFTGAVDSYGNEIYTNDIVDITVEECDYCGNETEFAFVTKVSFSKEDLQYVIELSNGEKVPLMDYFNEDAGEIKVLRNLYDKV